MFLKTGVNLISLLSAKVSYGTLYKLKVGVNGFSSDLAKLSLFINAIHAGICTKFKVYLIRFMYKPCSLIIPKNFRKCSSNIRRK